MCLYSAPSNDKKTVNLAFRKTNNSLRRGNHRLYSPSIKSSQIAVFKKTIVLGIHSAKLTTKQKTEHGLNWQRRKIKVQQCLWEASMMECKIRQSLMHHLVRFKDVVCCHLPSRLLPNRDDIITNVIPLCSVVLGIGSPLPQVLLHRFIFVIDLLSTSPPAVLGFSPEHLFSPPIPDICLHSQALLSPCFFWGGRATFRFTLSCITRNREKQ